MPFCSLCGGLLGIMGVLGTTEHFQCRNCGEFEHRPAANDYEGESYFEDDSYLEQGLRAEEEARLHKPKSLWERLKEEDS